MDFLERKLCTGEEIRPLLCPFDRFAHKGTLGHALLIGGSLGKMGSVCLASKAALRTGCELVTAYVKRKMLSTKQALLLS